MMAKIVVEAENNMAEFMQPRRRRKHRALSISETICESVAHAAQDLEMRAIAVFTETGTTARLISKYRPRCEIYALASNAAVCARMNLMWGVQPILCETHREAEDMVVAAEKILLEKHAVDAEDVIAIVAGTRTTSGSTNFMRLHLIGSTDSSGREDRRKSARVKAISAKRQ